MYLTKVQDFIGEFFNMAFIEMGLSEIKEIIIFQKKFSLFTIKMKKIYCEVFLFYLTDFLHM